MCGAPYKFDIANFVSSRNRRPRVAPVASSLNTKNRQRVVVVVARHHSDLLQEPDVDALVAFAGSARLVAVFKDVARFIRAIREALDVRDNVRGIHITRIDPYFPHFEIDGRHGTVGRSPARTVAEVLRIPKAAVGVIARSRYINLELDGRRRTIDCMNSSELDHHHHGSNRRRCCQPKHPPRGELSHSHQRHHAVNVVYAIE